ncbi:XRE family transcriptional regulator [Faecalibacterium sp. An192]|uniref:LexA family protein n=1 Tax=Faecalibacterium sp. An192 TaxID=1965581 RepID=UPI000B36A00A|nr:XRE family transcriptional regulator [Faecalibacterium sp. An192]OUP26946.1 hypothetical protein B5F27_11955 [Faecalibacterium sp. An192]
MATFSERLKSLRSEKGWSQQRLADELNLSKSSVNMYERGEREPGFETMEAIADTFNVDMDYLYGRTDVKIAEPIQFNAGTVPPGFEPLPRMVKKPLIGDIACGEPITAEQNIADYVDVPESVHCDFCLRCHGDSMVDAGIRDNDVVYIRCQPEVEDGEIAAVRIGGEATLKRVYYDGQSLTLMPANSSYRPKTYSGPELENIRIEGKAVGFTHWF